MKKLSFINKIIFLLNNIFAILLLASYFTPYIKPSSVSVFPLLSLATPILTFINIAFIVYWLIIGFKKQYLLSLLVAILGFFMTSSIYKFNSSKDKSDKELSIMTYNVRKFNVFKWLKDKNISSKIDTFILNEKPDIIAIQEYKEDENFDINYPFKYNPNVWKEVKSGLAIFSKYQIINSGLVKYYPLYGAAIYADIIKNTDTIRVYNIHLESLGVDPDDEYFGDPNSKKLLKKLIISLKSQEKQVSSLINHIQKCNYKVILVGDMNNTAYSWTYKNLKGELNDSFLEVGSGFGRTYSFKGFPLRIDYIFADENIKILEHKNYKVRYSDHYPVMTTLEL